jgi:hypothetical protein
MVKKPVEDDRTWFPQAREDYLTTMYERDVTSVNYDQVVEEAGLDWATVARQKLPEAGNMGWENLPAPRGLKPNVLDAWYAHHSGSPLEWNTWFGQLVIDSPQLAALVYCVFFMSLGCGLIYLMRRLWVLYHHLKAVHVAALVRYGARQGPRSCRWGAKSYLYHTGITPHRRRGRRRHPGLLVGLTRGRPLGLRRRCLEQRR